MATPVRCEAANFPLNEVGDCFLHTFNFQPDDFYSIGEAPNLDYKYHIEVHMVCFHGVPYNVFSLFRIFYCSHSTFSKRGLIWLEKQNVFFVYFKRVGGSRAVVICYQTGFAMSLSSLNLILEAENRTATQSQWDDTKARHEKKYYKHEREWAVQFEFYLATFFQKKRRRGF